MAAVLGMSETCFCAIFFSALAMPALFLVNCTEQASARYSRWRLTMARKIDPKNAMMEPATIKTIAVTKITVPPPLPLDLEREVIKEMR